MVREEIRLELHSKVILHHPSHMLSIFSVPGKTSVWRLLQIASIVHERENCFGVQYFTKFSSRNMTVHGSPKMEYDKGVVNWQIRTTKIRGYQFVINITISEKQSSWRRIV